MTESERTVHERAAFGEPPHRRVCTQLLADRDRYSLWRVRHDVRMGIVAARRERELQILTLRVIAIDQTHRTALVRYLRDYGVRGAARTATLRDFYGVLDADEAALTEHRNYLLAASTELCAVELLELVGDTRGLELLRGYETAYGQYFSMFCERARAKRDGSRYLLSSLLPEVRATAQRLRERVLGGHALPARPVAYRASA